MSSSRRIAIAATVLILGLSASPLHAQSTDPERRGFWIGFGFGYGSLGCEGCDSREGGASGYLKLGGTPSQKVQVGFESAGWTKDEDGATLTYGDAVAIVQFYPSEKGRFYLKGGLGLAYTELKVDLGGGLTLTEDQTGFGTTLGLGYDARLGRKLNLTPSITWQFGAFDGGNANLFMIAIGLTWY